MMTRRSTLGWLAALTLLSPARADEPAETFFELKVRPVLATECFRCHGGEKTSSGLSLASREVMLKGGDRGPAIVAGDPDRSLLIRAIRRTHDEVRMPPKKRLADETVADFVRWIAEGAAWPSSPRGKTLGGTGPSATAARHWAFEPVKAVVPPSDPTDWSGRPVDRFIAARRAAAGLQPVRRADRRTLIRRATFDLIGLPPTPGEIDAFVSDGSPDGFVRVVDRLLASPHYGERWGRHWMDVAHYADTAGDNADYPVPEVIRYRDYIIDAFNRDEPYDRFVSEQLAGDVLARGKSGRDYADSVAATAFLALSRRYGTGPYELWHLTLEDAIETTGRAFLGLTLRCARCHDHKFDPVTQRDYYTLYGMFASTSFPWAGSEETHSKGFPRMKFVPLVEPARAEPALKAYRERLAELERAFPALESAQNESARSRLAELKRESSRLKRTSLPPSLPGAYAVSEGQPTDVPLQRRGEPENSGPVIPHGVPRFAFLGCTAPPPLASGSSGRYELARWLTRPDHPLTARVMVNRIWQQHFGRGIVATPSNFGVRGEPPTHPELLDWLAARFVRDGWSIKAIHREIVLSETYQLSSDHDPRQAALDPDDRWLWRFPRRRLDAESIRDAMLAVSGRLATDRPGRHPFPPIEDWQWTQHDAFKTVYPSNHRSIYLMTQRLIKHPFLALFDGPDTNSSTDIRSRSTVPLQALYFLNNPFVLECAEGLAGRMIAAGGDPARRLAIGFELAWGRMSEPREVDRALRHIRDAASVTAEREAWMSLARILLTANEFLYID
jgi:hypothetical protein